MGSPSQTHMFVAALIIVGGAALSATTVTQQGRVALGRVRLVVAPSVAKANFLALGDELEACTAAGCEWLHCSVQDGVFVPKVSFGAPVVSAARKACPDTVIDVKLGCIDPENRVAEFAAAGADAISFHPEATKQPAAVAHKIRDAGVAPGIVLNPGTAVASVAPLLGLVDLAVVMLVSPGYGGPKYTELAVEKVKALRALRPDLHISVDGGVNEKIAPEFLRAGANVLVAGGAIFKADDKKAVVAELIGNAPHKRGRDIQAADNNSGPGGAASPFEDDACPDA
jgi:ribulose-phosphate 3-epimerase